MTHLAGADTIALIEGTVATNTGAGAGTGEGSASLGKGGSLVGFGAALT